MATPPDSLPPEVIAALERRQPLEALKLLLGRPARAERSTRPSAAAPAAPPHGAARSAAAPLLEPTALEERLSPGEVPRARSTVWGWVVLALVAYLAYRIIGA